MTSGSHKHGGLGGKSKGLRVRVKLFECSKGMHTVSKRRATYRGALAGGRDGDGGLPLDLASADVHSSSETARRNSGAARRGAASRVRVNMHTSEPRQHASLHRHWHAQDTGACG